MFNSTHTFVGFTVARTGFERWVPYATLTAVIAANLPDIEIFSGLSGTAAYLDHHRGSSHAFIGVPVLALLLSGAIYVFSGKFWRTFLVALTAMATHPLLDYMNTYGLRPYLPFDNTWYYGDLLFIFDLYLDSILLGGILLGARYRERRRIIAWVSLILAVAYIGVRVELRNAAAAHMQQFAARTPAVESWALLPTMLNPVAWNGILKTKAQFVEVRVDAIRGVGAEIARADRGSEPSEIVRQAEQCESAAALLRFARFPATRVETKQSGYRVLFYDFRFYNEAQNTALGAEVLLDRSLHVTKESLSFVQSVR
jgi:inner membrane protein